MRADRLIVKYKASNGDSVEELVRCTVEKWQWYGKYMGEQYVSFTIQSEKPIPFAVGDFCEYRGQVYTLNYVPSVKQQGNIGGTGNAFVYDSVKMDSCRDELGRTIMLDITPTTGDYEAYKGTNYTGSAVFSLYCGESTFNGRTLTPVCALAAKMQANMDRAYPTAGWKFHVDTESTHEESGKQVLNTHTDEKALSFNNTTVAAALAMVKDTFDINFVIIGRDVYIGYPFNALSSGDDGEYFYFGYGKGYADMDNQGKALFQLQRTSNSSQKIVTRLRALGSTKNLPYRYYNKKYNLSQTLFPLNLQLPDTFLPPEAKKANNVERRKIYPFLRNVLGDTNDAYIDKNDDCMSTAEGLREECARWDGSNSELEEIYPTIYEATYGELRAANCEDMDGTKGSSAFPNYLDDERIDEILAVDDDANVGDGIMSETNISNETKRESAVNVERSESQATLSYNGKGYQSNEVSVLTATGQYAGTYNISASHVYFGAMYLLGRHQSENITKQCNVKYVLRVYATDVITKEKKEIYKFESEAKKLTNRDGVYKEIEFVKLPNYKGGEDKKITITSLSDIDVTIQLQVTDLDWSYDQYSISWYLNNSKYEEVETETEWTSALIWDRENSASTFMDSPFHVIVKDMGFDFVAAFGTSETPRLSMKSGACVAREFEIANNPEKVEYEKNGKIYKAWKLTLKRCPDKTIYTYYPSSVNKLQEGDNFVLLNIEMPEVYILAAEVKLLVEATKYLADNCDTKFDYQPSIDDIYLQRNYDLCEKENRIEDSIYWKLYDGVTFPFYGIPEDVDDDKPLLNVVIDTITIKEGESLTPKVDIKLTDEATQGTIQKLSQTVSNITSGSIFNAAQNAAGGGSVDTSSIKSLISQYGSKNFLSKTKSDTAQGLITFLQGLVSNGAITAKEGANFGAFTSGTNGTGGNIDYRGNAELDSLFIRRFLSVPKFVFNQVNVTASEQWNTNAYGTIESVDTEKQQITLRLESNEYGLLMVGDICRGIFADIENAYGSDKNEEGSLDDCGFTIHRGFFTTYFYVKRIITNQRGKFVFEYGKRSDVTPDPCAFMDFAQYGNFTDESRQSSMYFSSRGKTYTEVLDGVKTWDIQPANRAARFGWLGNLTLEKKDGTTINLKDGNGLYVQKNIYFGGTVEHLSGLKEVDDLAELAVNYDVTLSQYQSVITVDDMGNVINGLYTEDEAKTTKQYRISTAVFVRKGSEILLEEDSETEVVTEGHYRLHVVSEDCEVEVKNSTVFVKGIRNIKDGVSGTEDDATFDYDAMRRMSDATVLVVVDLEGKTTKTVEMPIRIQHDSLPFMVCDISNENASVSWNTKANKYLGLPIKATVNLMYHNESWLISECKVVGGVPEGLTATVAMNKNGKSYDITIDGNPADDTLPQVSNIVITVVGRYAGANYEYTKTLTISKSADNVIYEIVPSSDSIVIDKDDNMSASYLTCDIYATSSDDKRYKLATLPEGFALKYGIDTDVPTTAMQINGTVNVSSGNNQVVFALYDKSGNVLDKESVPLLAYGKDGKGIEYVFKRTTDDEIPSISTPTDWATNTEYQRQDKEYVPTGWTDDPVGVNEQYLYEWVATRKSVNGVWQPFGEVSEYAHFGKHAARAAVTDSIVTIPTDSSGNALEAFSEYIYFSLLVDGLACSISSISTSDSLTNASYVISNSYGRVQISCNDNAALGKKAQTLDFKVVGTLNGATYQDSVTVKVIPNVTGEDGDGYEYIYYLCDGSKAPTSNPTRSNGVLSSENGIQWVDDVPQMTDTYRYIYVAWKRGEVGVDGGFSLPKLYTYKAKDGVGEVSAFKSAADVPTLKPTMKNYLTFISAETTETTDLGNGWTKKAAKGEVIPVIDGTITNVYKTNTDWYEETIDGITWWRNQKDMGHSSSSTTLIKFTTSENNMRVTFYLMASSEANYDFISISEVDSDTIRIKVSGDGVTSGAIKFDIKKAGEHYVTVTYSKDASGSPYNDCGYVRLAKEERWVLRYPLIYRCHGTVLDKTITWGDIIQETGDKGDQGDQGEQGEKGEPGIQGNRGYNGCIFRTSIWKTGVEYRNDTDMEDDRVKYIDIVYVEDSEANEGYRLYECRVTHISSATLTYGDTDHWREIPDVGPIYTPLIVAKNAVLKLAQGQSFTLVRNNTLFGCFRWTEQQSDFALWLGASVGNQAPFGVTAGGKVIATNAVIKGEITATSGTFNNCDIKDTCTITKIDAVKGTIAGLQIADSSISATTSTGIMNLTSNGLSLSKGNYYARIGTWTYSDVISGTTKTIPNIAVGGVNSSGGLVDVFMATNEGVFINTKHIQLLSLPTSSSGLMIGEVYNDNGTLKIR